MRPVPGAVDAQSGPWREVDSAATPPPAAPSVLVGLVVGAAVVAFLIWTDHLPAALLLAAVVITLTVARRLSPAFDRVFARVLGRFGHLVGVALSWVTLGLTMVFVVLPIWVISRIARWDTLEPGPRRGRWTDHRLPPWRRRPDRGFADDRRPLPSRTRVHGILTAAVPLALLAVLAFPLRDATLTFAGRITPGHFFFDGGDPPADTAAPTPSAAVPETDGIPDPAGDPPDGAPRDAMLSLQGEPWTQDLLQQYFPVEFDYDPYLTVRAANRSEPLVNVHDRVRRSYVPDAAADDPATLDVWFLGASALFGQGARDDHTIPSEVVRLAEDAGVPVRAQNFGVPSYWAWQDSVLLAQLLSERPAPDLIVTYEGYNDIANTLPAGSPTQVWAGFADQVRTVLAEAGADFAGAQGNFADTIPRTAVRSPQNAATVFGRAAALSRDLAAAHDLPIAQYLQPELWTRDLAVDDATLANIRSDREFHDSVAVGWNQARALMATDGVVDLGDSLDDVDELIYSDDVHTNELGSRKVAEAMYADLAPTLERLYAEKQVATTAP